MFRSKSWTKSKTFENSFKISFRSQKESNLIINTTSLPVSTRVGKYYLKRLRNSLVEATRDILIYWKGLNLPSQGQRSYISNLNARCIPMLNKIITYAQSETNFPRVPFLSDPRAILHTHTHTHARFLCESSRKPPRRLRYKNAKSR